MPSSSTGAPSSIRALIAASAATRPDARAICAPGRPPLSYGRLHHQLHVVRDALRRLGIGSRDRVALLYSDGPELAVALLSAAASATCAPLNPKYQAGEYDFYLSDLMVSALMVQSDLDSPAREAARRHSLPIIDLVADREAEAGIFTIPQALACASRESTGGEFAAGGDTATVLHTSGTNDRPKPVPMTHSDLCVLASRTAAGFGLTAQDRCVNLMPLYHGVGIHTTLAILASGGSVVLPALHDMGAFFAWLEEFRPSWYSATPAVHQAILSRAPEHRAMIARVPLRFIRSGAGELPSKLAERIEQTFRAPVVQSYGMTETGHICCTPMPPRQRKAGSVGMTMGLEVAVMDEAGAPVPPETTGEVVVRGSGIMSGYEAHPEANAAAFRNGWFRTGDLGMLDGDGHLFLKGRLKELINRGGEKVSPHEVEGVLSAHPDVAQAVVFPQPHATLGEEVAAAVVLRAHGAASEQDLRRWVAARIAEFKVPRRIIVVQEIPAESSGKIRRSQLAEHFGEVLQVSHRPAETPLELALAQIWSEALGGVRVGLHDDFFDLGGDSLSAARMCALIEEDVTGQSVPVSYLVQAPTVAELAHLLREAKPATMSGSCLVPVRAGGSRPPLFCLHGVTGFAVYLSLARHLGADQPVYGVQAPWVDGPVPSSVRFEDLAAQYVREIRTFFPLGDYMLCGHSVAGLLAWEVAQQLRALGLRVPLLALFDTRLYINPAVTPEPDSVLQEPDSGLRRLRRRFEFHLDNLRGLSPRDRLTYMPKRLGARWRRTAGATSPDSAGPAAAADDLAWSDTWPPLWQMVLRAGIAYLPRPYPGPIAVFLAQEPDADRGDGPGRLAIGPVEIHEVPGNHNTHVREPHVRVLAQKLRASLDRAVESARDRDLPTAPSGDPAREVLTKRGSHEEETRV